MEDPKKVDMSDTCDFHYFTYWIDTHNGNLSQEEWDKWYAEHCAKCVFMSEICMYGEVMLDEMS